MKIEEEIQLEYDKLISTGAKGPFYAVPVAPNLRCFVPCNLDLCICSGTISNNRFTLVSEHGKKKAFDFLNEEMHFLNERIRKLENR